MNSEINHFDELYQKASQYPDVLEKNAGEYPYSSLAGFLLLYHYKKTNHSGFEKLAKKTTLHFKNANWLQFLLDQTLKEKPGTAIITPPYLQEKNNVNKINADEIPPTASHQGSGNDVVEIADKEAVAVENEIVQQVDTVPAVTDSEVMAEITRGQNFEKPNTEGPETAAGEMAFEPLHTVDYFASQGIKITEEPEIIDKLGHQMKSFTAWLKSMKKLHPSTLGEQDLAIENQIQNSAEESNINTEILTEAMAEVLIKQNKREKAIEMYDKLSLINPSKRAYFAAKIESIKSS